MSAQNIDETNGLSALAHELKDSDKNIILIFAFNGTGKTRLSVEYKNATKASNDGQHFGVYYNAYSEDLFNWDNDEENDGASIKLKLNKSSLNRYHSLFEEDDVRDKLASYKPKYDFRFNPYADAAEGIESVEFFLKRKDGTTETDEKKIKNLKISRGEEQIFIWCFFLALFDVDAWTGEQKGHFFIDDPVSSLDDHNIFITAASVMDLVDRHFNERKIIITTHHVGFFSILFDWLKKGEKAASYKNAVQFHILKKRDNEVSLLSCNRDVFLYHLELMQTLDIAINNDELYAYHFALLRQVLENISSFLGVGRISFVLEQIGMDDSEDIVKAVNTMSHKNVFRYEARELVPDNESLFKEIFQKLKNKYNFVLHTR